MIRRSPPTPPPSDRTELIAAIAAKRTALRERDAALLARQVRLEQAGITPIAPRTEPDPRQMARELLNGFAPPLDQAGNEGQQLHAVRFEREAIEQALTILASKHVEERAIALAEMLRDTGLDWREITRARVDALLALRDANRRARRFREMLRQKTGLDPNLPADRMAGLFADPPLVGGQAYEFLTAAVEFGVATQKEIKIDAA